MKKNFKKIMLICLVVAIFCLIGFFLLLKSNSEISHQFIIPKGGTYYKGAYNYSDPNNLFDGPAKKKTYKAGAFFPLIPQKGDAYVYGDYEYIYNVAPSGFYIGDIENDYAYPRGWTVRAIDKKKTEYGTILETIQNNRKELK